MQEKETAVYKTKEDNVDSDENWGTVQEIRESREAWFKYLKENNLVETLDGIIENSLKDLGGKTQYTN